MRRSVGNPPGIEEWILSCSLFWRVDRCNMFWKGLIVDVERGWEARGFEEYRVFFI